MVGEFGGRETKQTFVAHHPLFSSELDRTCQWVVLPTQPHNWDLHGIFSFCVGGSGVMAREMHYLDLHDEIGAFFAS